MSASDTIRVRNWDKWQTYRRDRGQPPWIKVHREVMRNPDWVALTDEQRGQLISIWILAADRDGEIPSDPVLVKKLCYMDSEPDMETLVARGFLEEWRQGDVTVTPRCRQSDEPEAEAEAEKETDLSKLWRVYLEELGGSGRKPALTDKRRKCLTRLLDEQLGHEDDPPEAFRKVLLAVKASDHHMSERAYQMPESLFRNPERRERWYMQATQGKPSHRQRKTRTLTPEQAKEVRERARNPMTLDRAIRNGH